jgi:hypothetical protein
MRARGAVRLRIRDDGAFDLTLVDPARDFAALVCVRPGTRLVTTVHHGGWSQLESGPAGQTVTTRPEDHEVRTVVRAGGMRHSVTLDGQAIRWGSPGTSRSSGEAFGGSGRGVDAAGRSYSYHTNGDTTVTTVDLGDGWSRTTVKVEGPNASRSTWETKDSTGRVVGTGSQVEDRDSGTTTKHTESDDENGGKVVSDSTTQGNTKDTTSTRTDAAGNVTETSRSVEAKDAEGNSSKTTSSIDHTTGEVTITTESTGSDGSWSQHTTVTDSNGNVVRDETLSKPGRGSSSGSTGQGSSTGSGDDDSDDEGDSDDDDSNDDDDGGDGEDDGGGDDGGGDDGSSRHPDDGAGGPPWRDDDGDGKPDIRPGEGGSWRPGGPVGWALEDLGVLLPGGSGDGEDFSDLPGVVGERLRRVIAVMHGEADAGAGSGGGWVSEPLGMVSVDVRLPLPPGAVDDWGDRPHPQALQALNLHLLNGMAMLGSTARGLRSLSRL